MEHDKTFPFAAAIFDLDGTLLNSLHVWRQVDHHFFGARGIVPPEDYARAVSGLSFAETVAYTINRFELSESPEAVFQEWTALSQEEYAHHVTLVRGAREYLRMLKRGGVRLAAATANRPQVFMPALEHNGIAELFDAILTTDDAGGRNKSDGALFRMTAERLGIAPEDCAVFEDALEGVLGARAAGMRVYAVESAGGLHTRDEIAAQAEAVIRDYEDMRQIHPFPDNARRCVIVSAHCEGDIRAAWTPEPDDCVFCADGGWRLTRAMGVRPDLVLGDFDSSEAPEGENVRRFPVEKDDTDTMLCLKEGLSRGFDRFLIVGGFGGRLDHTLANLQTLHYAARRDASAEMCDGTQWATVVCNGSVTVPRRRGKLGVFALDGACRGIILRGTKYDVEGLTLEPASTRGACNDFMADTAKISVAEGALLVLVCPE